VASKWKELSKATETNETDIQKAFVYHVSKTLARSAFNIDDFAAYQALAHTMRDEVFTLLTSGTSI
jgi:glycogen phosphorylase